MSVFIGKCKDKSCDLLYNPMRTLRKKANRMQTIIDNITNTDSFLESLKAFASSISFSTVIMLIMVFFMIVGP